MATCIATSLFRKSLRCSVTSSSMFYSSKPRGLKGKKPSSQQWLQRQLSDPYVKKARFENYRCRSAFKLIELDEKFGLLYPGAVVLDCGASPGSWTQVAVERACHTKTENAKADGLVIGIDLEHMMPVEGAYIIHQSDFTSPQTQQKIVKILNGREVDVVVSDMAPRATGQKSLDHDCIVQLCFSLLMFSKSVLRPGGDLVCKLWQGGEQKKLEEVMRSLFEKVKVAKPASSRTDSAEIFLVGKKFKELTR